MVVEHGERRDLIDAGTLPVALGGDVDPGTGLLADPTPPFALYPANLSHIGLQGNPLGELPPP